LCRVGPDRGGVSNLRQDQVFGTGLIAKTTESDLAKIPQIKRDPTDPNIAFVTADLVQQWQFSTILLMPRFPAGSSIVTSRPRLPSPPLFPIRPRGVRVLPHQPADLRHGQARHQPAYVIFERFLERAREREAYQTNVLQNEKFDFSATIGSSPTATIFPIQRLSEATNLWHEEVRLDYLDEKLREKIVFTGPVTFDAGSNLSSPSPARTPTPPPSISSPEKFWTAAAANSARSKRPALPPTPPTPWFTSRFPRRQPVEDHQQVLRRQRHQLGAITFARVPEPVVLVTNEAGPQAAIWTNIAGLLTNYSLTAPVEKKYTAEIRLNQKDTASIVRNLQKRYVQILKNYNELTNDGHVLEYYLTSLARAYDPTPTTSAALRPRILTFR